MQILNRLTIISERKSAATKVEAMN